MHMSICFAANVGWRSRLCAALRRWWCATSCMSSRQTVLANWYAAMLCQDPAGIHIMIMFEVICEFFIELFYCLQMFFIVHLYSCGTVPASLPPVRDPDPQFGGELADGRVALLVFCRERRLEFSTLRRATFTSMVMCHELHVEQANSVGRLIRCCRRCPAKTLLAYTCTTCEVWCFCYSFVCSS